MIKCTALFQYASNVTGVSPSLRRTGGWSESIYHAGTVSTAKTDFVDYCSLRARILPFGTSIIGQRFQVVDGGSSTLGRVFPGNPAYVADMPQVGIQLSALSGNALNTRRWAFRGIPDIMVKEGEYVPTSAFRIDLLAAAGFTSGGSWRFRGRVLDGTIYTINEITTAGILTVIEAGGFVPGNVITLLRAVDADGKGVSGSFVISEEDPDDNFHLQNWGGRAVVRGNFRISAFDFFTIDGTTISAEKAVMRKVGRPFAGYRGRRSNRR